MYREDIDKLLQEYEPVIDKVANLNPVKSSHFKKEDLKQEFRMILVKCNDTFDKTKKTSFKSYFIQSCKHFVWDEWKSRRHPMHENLDKTMVAEGRRTVSYVDYIPDEAITQDNQVYDLMQALDDTPDGWIVKDVLYQNRTYEDIGKELGVSRERVRQRYENALDKLRSLVGAEKKNL